MIQIRNKNGLCSRAVLPGKAGSLTHIIGNENRYHFGELSIFTNSYNCGVKVVCLAFVPINNLTVRKLYRLKRLKILLVVLL